jgi:hypothetical protein
VVLQNGSSNETHVMCRGKAQAEVSDLKLVISNFLNKKESITWKNR